MSITVHILLGFNASPTIVALIATGIKLLPRTSQCVKGLIPGEFTLSWHCGNGFMVATKVVIVWCDAVAVTATTTDRLTCQLTHCVGATVVSPMGSLLFAAITSIISARKSA